MSRLSWADDTEESLKDLQDREKALLDKKSSVSNQLRLLEEEVRELRNFIRKKCPHEIPAEALYGSPAKIRIIRNAECCAVLVINNEKVYRLLSFLEAHSINPTFLTPSGENFNVRREPLTRNASYKALEIQFTWDERSKMIDMITMLKLDVKDSIKNAVDLLSQQIAIREELRNEILTLGENEKQVGVPGQRDPDFPCMCFSPGEPDGTC